MLFLNVPGWNTSTWTTESWTSQSNEQNKYDTNLFLVLKVSENALDYCLQISLFRSLFQNWEIGYVLKVHWQYGLKEGTKQPLPRHVHTLNMWCSNRCSVSGDHDWSSQNNRHSIFTNQKGSAYSTWCLFHAILEVKTSHIELRKEIDIWSQILSHSHVIQDCNLQLWLWCKFHCKATSDSLKCQKLINLSSW